MKAKKDKRPLQVSVPLTKEELQVADELASKRKCSRAAIMRIALSMFSAHDREMG